MGVTDIAPQQSNSASATPRPFRFNLFVPILIACALLLFAQNLTSYFLADDFVLLSWTRSHSLSAIPSFFDPNTFWFYRPIVKLVYWAGQGLFGMRAAPFHILSLALHGVNAYLLYRLVAYHLGGGWVTGLAASLIFLTIPHHAESVSWIAVIGDLIATCCLLCALLLYSRYADGGKTVYLLGLLGFFAVALLSRETSVMLLPLLVLASLILRLDARLPMRRRALVFVACIGLVLAYLLVQVLGRAQGQESLARGGLQFRALNPDSILLAILEYMHGLLPGGLLARLPVEALRVIVWPEWLLILLLAYLLWRTGRRLALFGLAWMLITPLVFIFFSPPADRYYYLPSIGFAIAAASLLTDLARLTTSRRFPTSSRWAGVAAGLLVAVLVLWQSAQLYANEQGWRAAGIASGGLIHDTRQAVQDPRDYTAFYYVGLPETVRGVPLFGGMIKDVIQLIYDNDTLSAFSVNCDYLRKQTELPRYNFLFHFKPDGAEPFATAGDCRD
ncbi:MAG: glycosyltransferase family 39 protein [Chloroflexia bacterium]